MPQTDEGDPLTGGAFMNVFSWLRLVHVKKWAPAPAIALALLMGCAPGVVVVDKPMEAPLVVACCSATGHNPSNIPFILGGKCFCTPSREVIDAMHAAGQHLDVDFKKLVQMYADAGITTDLDHKGCNNLCSRGPHVAFGGKCMATPTPGTKNYERVLTMTAAAPSSAN
jgi:hypothetical protein